MAQHTASANEREKQVTNDRAHLTASDENDCTNTMFCHDDDTQQCRSRCNTRHQLNQKTNSPTLCENTLRRFAQLRNGIVYFGVFEGRFEPINTSQFRLKSRDLFRPIFIQCDNSLIFAFCGCRCYSL